MTQRKNILVVDDNVGCRESLRLILNSLYEVTMAKSGDEALDYLREKDTDLIILDLIMPGLTGFDFLKAMRKMKQKSHVLIITGCCDFPNTQKAIELGAVGMIAKPFTVPEVVMSVTRILGQGKDKTMEDRPM